MATPTSPIGISDIFFEANGATPSSPVSFSVLTSNTYFAGPNGANTQNFNSWGANQGDNGIFSVANNGQATDRFSPYRNVSYFYDQTQYQISFQVDNNLTPNPPSTDTDMTVFITYMDSSLTYAYMNTNTGTPVQGGSTYGPAEGSIGSTPLIYGCNWKLEIIPDSTYVGGAVVDLTINGSTLITGGTINTGGSTFFDYTSYSNEFMTLNQPVAGATGSLIYVTIS